MKGVIAAVAMLVFWFIPDFAFAIYVKSTGALALVHFPTWTMKMWLPGAFTGGKPKNHFPRWLGGELEIAARKESARLLQGVLQGVLVKSNKGNNVDDDVFYVLKPLLEELNVDAMRSEK